MPKYSEDQKREAVKRYQSGEPVMKLAKEFGVDRQAIYWWIRSFEKKKKTTQRSAPFADFKQSGQPSYDELLQENLKLKAQLWDLSQKLGVKLN